MKEAGTRGGSERCFPTRSLPRLWSWAGWTSVFASWVFLFHHRKSGEELLTVTTSPSLQTPSVNGVSFPRRPPHTSSASMAQPGPAHGGEHVNSAVSPGHRQVLPALGSASRDSVARRPGLGSRQRPGKNCLLPWTSESFHRTQTFLGVCQSGGKNEPDLL